MLFGNRKADVSSVGPLSEPFEEFIFQMALFLSTVSTNAFHSKNLYFCFWRYAVLTNIMV